MGVNMSGDHVSIGSSGDLSVGSKSFNVVHSDVQKLKVDVADLQERVIDLEDEVATLKSKVATLETDNAKHKTDIASIMATFAAEGITVVEG